ncbi:MAG: hypothetical protein ACRD3M_15800 [Thermoanaerobaculia bacterium]
MRVALLSVLAGGTLTASGAAQELIPATSAPGRLRVETGFRWSRYPGFVDGEGNLQSFPGAAEFLAASLRLSFSFARSLAAGVEVPYRGSWYRLADPGETLASQGVPGFGAFLEWAPGSPAARFPLRLRMSYRYARPESDDVLTISDGADRFAALLQVSSAPGALAHDWRAAATLQLEYAPPVESRLSYGEVRLNLLAGPRLARVGAAGELRALALAGFRVASEARQEGNYFQDGKSSGFIAGVLLDLEVASKALGSTSLRLDAAHDVFARNALSGWRLGFVVSPRLW